jgi:hypothetical protein
MNISRRDRAAAVAAIIEQGPLYQAAVKYFERQVPSAAIGFTCHCDRCKALRTVDGMAEDWGVRPADLQQVVKAFKDLGIKA